MVVTCFSGRVAQTTWDAARGSGEDVKMLMKVMRRRRFVMMLTMKWETGDFLISGPFVTDIEKSSFK